MAATKRSKDRILKLGERVNPVAAAFKALPANHYGQLLQNGNYYTSQKLTTENLTEIKNTLFGDDNTSDAAELFSLKITPKSSAADLMLWFQNFAINTLRSGFAIPANNANPADIMHDIERIDKRYDFTNTNPDMLNKAYIALVYAAKYGSGLALKLLRDLQLLPGLSDLTSEQKLPTSYKNQSILFDAFVLNNPGPEEATHNQVAAQQLMPDVSEHPAHWRELLTKPEGLEQYNLVKALLEKVEAKIDNKIAETGSKPFDNVLAYLQRATNEAAININDTDLSGLVAMRNQLLANLIALAPNASNTMKAEVARSKQSLVNATSARHALARPTPLEGRKYNKSTGYTDLFIGSKAYNDLKSEMQAKAKADYDGEMQAYNTAITTADNALATTQQAYNRAQANLDATDPRIIRVSALLKLIITDIARFSSLSKLTSASNGRVYSIIEMLAICIAQDTRDLGVVPNELPQGNLANNDYYAFYKLFADTNSAGDNVKPFIDGLANKLYNSEANSSLKGQLSTTKANRATANQALLHNPIIMAVLLIGSLNINNVTTHEADVARIKNQVRVFEQYFGARLDEVSDLAIKLRNTLVLSAAVLLDQYAINTLRLEPSSNPLALEGVTLDADFQKAVRKISFATPSYEHGISFYNELKEVLDASGHPFAKVFREIIVTLLVTYPMHAMIAAEEKQNAYNALPEQERRKSKAPQGNDLAKLTDAQQAKMQDYGIVNAPGIRKIEQIASSVIGRSVSPGASLPAKPAPRAVIRSTAEVMSDSDSGDSNDSGIFIPSPKSPEQQSATDNSMDDLPELVAASPVVTTEAKDVVADAKPAEEQAQADVNTPVRAPLSFLGDIAAAARSKTPVTDAKDSAAAPEYSEKQSADDSTSSLPELVAASSIVTAEAKDVGADAKPAEEQAQADVNTPVRAPLSFLSDIAAAARSKAPVTDTKDSAEISSLKSPEQQSATDNSMNELPAPEIKAGAKDPDAQVKVKATNPFLAEIAKRRKSVIEEEKLAQEGKEKQQQATSRDSFARAPVGKQDSGESAAKSMFGEGAAAFLARRKALVGNNEENDNRESMVEGTRLSEW